MACWLPSGWVAGRTTARKENVITKKLKHGDHVTWSTPQGETSGKIQRKVTSRTKVKGHVAKATKADPQYVVRSDKSGDEAVHHSDALKKQ